MKITVKAGMAVAASLLTFSAWAEQSGEQVYQAICAACHANGVGGAPQTGDHGAWDARLQKGVEVIYANAINGISEQGMMPPMGMCMKCSEDEVKAAVDYMLEQLP